MASATSIPDSTRPSLNDLAAEYTRTKDPKLRDSVLEELKPTIGFALTRFTGGVSDPVLRAKAYAMAVSSLDKFDPSRGVNVKTYVVNNLQPLSRQKRLTGSTTRLSERMQLDAMTLDRMRVDYEDKHGREPDDDALADMTGLSPSRIRRVRQSQKLTPSESAGGFVEDGATVGHPVDFQREAVDYIYNAASPLDRKLLTGYLGLTGEAGVSAREFSRREKVGLATVSDRSHKLMDEVQKLTQILEGASSG